MTKRGRKPLDYEKYLPQLESVLIGGATIKDACAYVGIGQSSFYEWTRDYPQFSEAIEKARASAKVACVTQIRQAAKSEWQAAAWFLERSDPSNWGRKDMIISLGLDPTLLRTLKQRADLAGVPLSEVFEAMINELSGTYAATDRAE